MDSGSLSTNDAKEKASCILQYTRKRKTAIFHMSSTAKSTRESRRVSVTALVSLAHQQQQEDIEDELSKGLSVCSRSLCGCLFFFFLVLLAEMEGSVGQKAMACLFSSGGGLAGHWCTQGASSVSLLCWASIAKDTNSICCQKKKKKKKTQHKRGSSC